MGQFIEFGQKAPKAGIERFDCAQGVTVKAMLLNYRQPYVRNLAFDEVNGCTVECTREMAIKYGLNPVNCYFFLVAAFATDLNGDVIGDKEVKVTYLRMKNQQYERFLAASNNIGEWNGLVTLSKVEKRVEGRDFSYVEAMPAVSTAKGFNTMSQQLKDRIGKLSEDKEVLTISVQMIDNATGLYEDKYLEHIQQKKAQKEAQLQGANGGAAQQQSQPVAAPQQPQQAQIPQSTQPNAAPASKTVAASANAAKTTTATAPAAAQDEFIQPVDADELPF